MKKKKLNEAGNFNKLSPAEVQMLKSYSPQFANSVGQIVSSFRQKGKQITLPQAVQQMKEVGYQSPEIDKFLQSSTLLDPMKNVQGDPFKKRDSIPGATPVASPQQAAAAPVQLTPKNIPIKQRLQMAGGKMQQQPQQMQPTPHDEFEKIRTNPNMSNDDMLASRSPSAPITNRKQLKDKWSEKGRVDPLAKTSQIPVKEAMGMAASGKLRQVMDLLKRLKPEELVAITNMINSLNTTSGVSRMSTQLNANKNLKLNTKQQLVTEVLMLKINEQREVSKTAKRLLEGPMGNIWDQIKGAGSAIGQKLGLVGQMGQQAQAVGVDENAKKVAAEMQKILGKINQVKSKFNSSILKNSESLNSYHDLVLNAVNMFSQYQGMLGPLAQQLGKQVHDAVGQLVYDLNSEKEQVDAFLKQLSSLKLDKSAKSLGGQAKKRAQQARAAENPDAGLANMKRNLPFAGGSIDPAISDDLTKSQAFAKVRAGDPSGGMNDLQKLYLKQIERQKGKKSKSTKKK